jgi:hypothetical protein
MFAMRTLSFFLFQTTNRPVFQDMAGWHVDASSTRSSERMSVRSDQPALYMAIPAPARFTDLRQHLHNAGIDAAYLSLTLENYLAIADNMPSHDWMLDPHDDHQAWAYREVINHFMEMVEEKEDSENEIDESLYLCK